MNSIDCAREAKCFDVLLNASEDKEFNEADYKDFELERAKSKHK